MMVTLTIRMVLPTLSNRMLMMSEDTLDDDPVQAMLKHTRLKGMLAIATLHIVMSKGQPG